MAEVSQKDKKNKNSSSDGGRCPDFAAILKESEPDHELHEQIASCFHKELSRQAIIRCKDESLADDAAQDALLNALESLGSFRGDSPINFWLRKLVITACSRLRRGRKNDPAFNIPLNQLPETQGDDKNQETQVLLIERFELLQKALEEQPEDNKTMLLLHESQQIPLSELASRYGLTIDGVKSRLKRTRAKVRERLIELAESQA